MQLLRQEIRYGLRKIRESPGFAAVTMLTRALGIGANTAIFGVLDPLVLRNLPLWRPDELVEVAPIYRSGAPHWSIFDRDRATAVMSSLFAGLR